MELIPLIVITLDGLVKSAPYISAVVTFLLGLYKDTIMSKLNMKKSKKEVDLTTSDVIEKNLGLYQKMLDDYAARKEDEDKKQEARIKKLEERVRITEEEKENEVNTLSRTVDKLQSEVKKLTKLVNKLGKQIAFYREHSDLELPEDLQD